MKKLIVAGITIGTAASVFAQGTVIFVNRSAGGTSHVYFGGFWQVQGNGTGDVPAGSVNWSGYQLVGTIGGLPASTTFAQLLGAPGSGAPESSLVPGLPTTTFRTGAGSGNVALATATFNNIAPDAAVGSFEMVAWDNSSGLYPTWTQASIAWGAGLLCAGRSAEFNIQSIGGSVNTPPNIEPGLTSFNIVPCPEPATTALAGVGTLTLLMLRRRK